MTTKRKVDEMEEINGLIDRVAYGYLDDPEYDNCDDTLFLREKIKAKLQDVARRAIEMAQNAEYKFVKKGGGFGLVFKHTPDEILSALNLQPDGVVNRRTLKRGAGSTPAEASNLSDKEQKE